MPQGSNLGPLLFLIYIKNLPNCLETANTSLFADEINLSCEGKSSPEFKQKLNADLDNVHNWLMANKLTLNREKTEYTIVASRQRVELLSIGNLVVTIAEQKIKRVLMEKVLGVIIDDQLKWDKHNNVQCKTISRSISLLKRDRQFVPQETLLTMYNSFVLPHFSYYSTIWHDGNNTNMDKLYKLQKRAARVLTGSQYDERSTETCNNLSWNTIN